MSWQAKLRIFCVSFLENGLYLLGLFALMYFLWPGPQKFKADSTAPSFLTVLTVVFIIWLISDTVRWKKIGFPIKQKDLKEGVYEVVSHRSGLVIVKNPDARFRVVHPGGRCIFCDLEERLPENCVSFEIKRVSGHNTVVVREATTS